MSTTGTEDGSRGDACVATEQGAGGAGVTSGAIPWGPVAIVVLTLLSGVAASPLFAAGWFGSHEEIRPVARALAAYYEIADGDLYPRWISTGYLGKGVPLFNFYPPAFSFTVAWLHAAGVPILAATKAVLFALFLIGALGAFAWVRPHLGGPAGLVAGILYLFAPYHFVDLYVRGATAEFTSLAVLPWLFYGVDRVIGGFTAARLAAVALASAGIVLSHFLSALMILPFAAGYAVVRVLATRAGWRGLLRVGAGGGLGAAVSAFFWLPALAERTALSPTRQAKIVEGYNSPFLHFVEVAQWFDSAWEFGASYPPGYRDEMSFQVGYLLTAAVLLAAAAAWRLARGERDFVVLSLALGTFGLWLTTAASAPWYEILTPYRMVQFPWRFLGPATVFLAAGAAGALAALPRGRRWTDAGAIAAVAALSVALSADHRTVRDVLRIPDDRRAVEALLAVDGWSAKFGNEDEYLPDGADPHVANFEPGGLSPMGVGVEFEGVAAGRTNLRFDAIVGAGHGVVVVPVHDFPGWRVTVDGRDASLVDVPNGVIGFSLGTGRHAVRVWFGTTGVRIAGWLIALGGVGVLGALALRRRW